MVVGLVFLCRFMGFGSLSCLLCGWLLFLLWFLFILCSFLVCGWFVRLCVVDGCFFGWGFLEVLLCVEYVFFVVEWVGEV